MSNYTCQIIHVKLYMSNYTCQIIHVKLYMPNLFDKLIPQIILAITDDFKSFLNCHDIPVHFWYHSAAVQGKKLGHRRVKDGEVTYKKFETGQLMGSIQLGIQNSVGNLTAQVLTILIFIFFILT